jgi:hypothetical protein
MTDAMILRDKRMKQLAMAELRWDSKQKAYVGLYPWNNDQKVSYDAICNNSEEDWERTISQLKALKTEHMPEKKRGVSVLD